MSGDIRTTPLIRSRIRRSPPIAACRSASMVGAAPIEWVGAHTNEAKLHRRLGTAMSGLRAATDDDRLVAANVDVVAREALKIEHQIVAASHLAPRLKGPAIEELARSVDQIEDVSAQLIQRSTELSSGDVQAQLTELSERLDLLDAARAELDGDIGETRRGSP